MSYREGTAIGPSRAEIARQLDRDRRPVQHPPPGTPIGPNQRLMADGSTRTVHQLAELDPPPSNDVGSMLKIA